MINAVLVWQFIMRLQSIAVTAQKEVNPQADIEMLLPNPLHVAAPGLISLSCKDVPSNVKLSFVFDDSNLSCPGIEVRNYPEVNIIIHVEHELHVWDVVLQRSMETASAEGEFNAGMRGLWLLEYVGKLESRQAASEIHKLTGVVWRNGNHIYFKDDSSGSVWVLVNED